jgi:methyl-accepting chemotaxis protein
MHLQTTKIPLRDAAGTVTGLVGIGRDITPRVAEARALDGAVRESREVIQAVLAGAGDRRIGLAGKSGNLLLLAISINELIDSVSTTVAETVQVVRRAVTGDLTSRLSVTDKPGDFKALAASVNSMIQAMMEVVASLTQTARAVQVGAEEISQGNLDLSKRTEEQTSSLVETTASMEQMTAMVKNNANSAVQANQLAVSARERAERGGGVVGAAVAAMGQISAASNKIAEIIGVIDAIAFQTNLLALNAAVEAARAGEQGKGFAVVAAEVRNLASRSAEAAKQIKALIQDSVGKVHEGTKLVDESGKVLGEIVSWVKKVTDVMAEIADSSREQAAGIEQVNRAVTAMDAATQQNGALVEQATAAAQALSEQATSLMRLIVHYRLS